MAERSPTSRGLIKRDRLIDLLAERFQRRLTVVEAGAGFGKTTAMRQAIAHSAEVGDDREAVIDVPRHGGLGRQQAIAAIADTLGVAPTISAITNDILAASPAETVIWFDDVHRIGADPEWLATLLDALPGNAHMVLVGRSMPRLATARLEVEGQVSHVAEPDLRFDADERGAFAALRNVTISTASDGWPALMELEASAGRSSPLDYLVDEVLHAVEPARLALLRRAALADRIDDELLASLGGGSTAAELVEGLPMVQVIDGTGPDPQYVLHDLVRDALVAGLDPPSRSAAEQTIAAELLRRGRHAAAARYAARAGDTAGVQAVAESLLADMHFDAPAALRREAVEAVQHTLGESALTLTLVGATETITAPSRAADTLHRAIDAARAEHRPDLVAIAATRLAEIGYSTGSVSEAVTHRDLVVRLADEGDPTARRLRVIPDIYVLRMTGRTAEVPAVVDRWLADGTIADDEMRAVAMFYRTVSLAYTGRVREALAEVDRLSAALPPGLFANRVGGVVATQRWQLGLLTAADRAATSRLVERIGASGQAQLFVEGAAATAIFHATAGEVGAARRLVAAAESGLVAMGTSGWSTHTVAQARATLAVIDGDEERARTLLDAAIPAAGPVNGLPSHAYFFAATLSYLLVPRTRDAWEALPVEPDLTCRLEVGRALVAFRDTGDTAPAAALAWEESHRIRPFAPGPLLVELAVAAASAGNRAALRALRDAQPDAIRVLERLGRSDDPAVAESATTAVRTTPRRPRHQLQIGLLGPLSVRRDGTEEAGDEPWRRSRQRDLLGVLVRDRRTTRDAVATELWGDREPTKRSNNLRVTLSYLIVALEPERVEHAPSWFLRLTGEDLILVDSDELELDVDSFADHVARAQSLEPEAPLAALAEHRAACELYRGDFLAGLDDRVQSAAYYETLRLRGLFVSSAVRAAELLLAIDEPAEAEALAARALEVEALTEPALRTLARALLAQRRISAATDVVRGLLAELSELHLAPEPETVRLATQLRIR